MGRPRGGRYSVEGSTPVAVRIPNDLLALAIEQCGGKAQLAEWMRNMIRRACSVPIDRDAGYKEGFMAGWSDANKKFRAGLQGNQ